MCGIIGLSGVKSFEVSIKGFLTSSMELLSHRGPNSYGSYEDGFLYLGHLRLAIQDLSSNGHQPMWSDDSDTCIIFNGEIYNHYEIRNQLKTKRVFKSSGDTETLLYAFLEQGTSLFNKLNGIFALAIYVKSKKQLFIARDHFGIKPLYYYKDSNFFLFSSEIKVFNNCPVLNKEIDQLGLANYLSFLYCPGERTPFLHVKKLLPGHFIILGENCYKIEKYYELPFNGSYSCYTEDGWIDLLDEKLTMAVQRQLLSDVPIGFFCQ